MNQGIVKWYSDKKGMGFISDNKGTEYYVHYSQIMMDGFQTLQVGDNVTFEIKETNKGPSAIKVKKI